MGAHDQFCLVGQGLKRLARFEAPQEFLGSQYANSVPCFEAEQQATRRHGGDLVLETFSFAVGRAGNSCITFKTAYIEIYGVIMDQAQTLRDLLLVIATIALAISMGIGMVTLFKRKNLILGAEWMVMFVSSCNIIVWSQTGNDWQWDLVWFLDAFSRVAGMNILLYLGFAQLTHNYRPSIRVDILLFVVIGILAACVMYVDVLIPARHYIFSAAHFVFLPLLVFLTYEMHRLEKTLLMVFMGFSTVTMTISTVLIDFAVPTNNDTNVLFNKDFVSLVSWAFGYLVISRVYVAMDEDRKLADPKGTVFK